MFIRRSKYKAILESRDKWKELAIQTTAQNEALLCINEKLDKNLGELIKIYKSLAEEQEKKYTENKGE
jgi:hypothetical protein